MAKLSLWDITPKVEKHARFLDFVNYLLFGCVKSLETLKRWQIIT